MPEWYLHFLNTVKHNLFLKNRTLMELNHLAIQRKTSTHAGKGNLKETGANNHSE